MRSRLRYAAAHTLLFIFFIIAVAGCSREEPAVFNSNPVFRLENPENENVAGMLQQTAAGTVVRLSTGHSLGSGVIFRLEQDRMVVVTAAHVVSEAEVVNVELIEGTVMECRDILISDGADLAFLRMDTAQMSETARDKCLYVAVNQEAFDGLAEGDGIIVMGFAEEAAANAYEGKVLSPWIYVEDFEQYMLWGRTDVRPGMSGGGVFDLQGYFVGILCGGDEENQIAVLPLSIIEAEYLKLF